jgi:hypothetical protein
MTSMVNLKKAISLITEMSTVSDEFESSVAKSINSKFKGTGITASRPPADTSLPDVLVKVKDVGESFIEVKMSHSDNLANPRVFFDGTTWQTTYKTPVAQEAIKMLNQNDDAKAFVADIKAFTKKKVVKLPTTLGGLKDPDAVSLAQMFEFVEARGSRYISENKDINIGRLATLHYTVGKSVPADYLQVGDDFYLIGNSDPFDLSTLNGNKIPRLGGKGDFRVRVSTRSTFYEIQIEMKIKKFNPVSSAFSVLNTSSKINPFDALADSISSITNVKSKTKKV